ncbi:EAL domain-containing protein [Microcoleus sp. FACHB-68]|uniref:EAL domain-containing protein n=1 Tax=Microcoleus sp. FACHB-68 TaxID=2692826 RepID=UPI001686A005|nr:EAL domain-containing protein [Microcoleus sp. FACHB-68]MBD1939004.1 EAL domain-containing protein [Microcoleus sp. FACHB-68]
MSHTQVAGQAVGQHRNNEGVLKEHANPLWAVLQHSLDGLFIVDVQPAEAASTCCEDTDRVEAPEFRFVATNPACRQMLLVTPEDPVGLRLQECLPEGIAGTTAKHLTDCVEQRQSIEYEAILETRTDSTGNICTNIRHLVTRLSPVFGQDGTITQIIGLCQDFTEYRRVEAQAQLLQNIALAIAAAEDFQTALGIALRYCCEATGWNYGEAWIPSPDTDALYCSPAYYISTDELLMFIQISQGLQFPKGIGLPGRVWLSKQAAWHQDVSIESESIFLRAQLAMSWGLKAGLGVPIIANDQVLAVLVFFMFESCPADRRMVELVSAVAAQLGTLMQRKQAEDALRESQRKLAHLINSLPGFVFSCASDSEWSMSYLSEGVFNLIEYHREELAGKSRLISYSDLTHPEDLPKVLQAIETAIAKKEPYVVEYRIRTKSGLEKWLWEKGSGVFDNMGNVLALEGFITDISERKQTEEALKAQAQVLESMAEGVSVADENGMITFTNPAFDAMFGYERGELQGKHFSTLNVYPLSENARLTVKIIEQLNKQGSWLGEFNNLKKDKTLFTTYAHISALEMSGKKYWVCVQEDITERKRAEEALKQAEEKYRSIFENAVEGIFQTTPEGRYLTANSMLARIYGYDSPAELMATLTDIQHQLYVNPDRRLQFSRLLQERDAVLDFESEIYRKDGSTIWISENARAIRDTGGTLLGYEGTVVDITQRKQAEAELLKRDNLLQGVAEAMNYLLTDTNHGSAIIKALATLGIAAGVDRVYICQNHPHPVTGEPALSMRFEWVRDLIEPMLNKPHWQNLAYSNLCRWYDSLSANQPMSGNAVDFPAGERERLEADGIVSILMVPISVNNECWGYVGFDDCHRERGWSKSEESILVAIAASIGGALQRHQQEETIRHQALHDRLTGLPNRQLLDLQLTLALETAANRRHKLAIIFLDLDRFKIINDTLGHAVGDQLLKNAAQRLKSCLREGDTIVRWGGDEFITLLPHLNCLEDALHIAQRIIDSLQPAFEIEGHHLYITSSIGIALYPNDGEDGETLIKNADTALYQAKERGRNNYQIFTPSMNAEASALLVLDNSLHLAFERGEFLIHYQPQLNINTGKITCMEALVRWQHPERGLMTPEAFIPLAEENGLIVPLGKWVLQTACAQNKAWQDAGLPAMRVTVNLSTRQFQQPGLVAMVAQVLKQTGLEPQYLELEITETTAMLDADFTSDTLGELKAMGICLSMDDFGVGYASLSGLKNFPFHTLKIDRAFVQDITSNPHDRAIVKAILGLAHALNLSMVAEGVETDAQKELLRSLHCQEMQGYLFSKPLTAGEATDFITTINRKIPKG